MEFIDAYIDFVILPLEEFRKQLIQDSNLLENDPLVLKVDDDLFQKYQTLSNMIERL